MSTFPRKIRSSLRKLQSLAILAMGWGIFGSGQANAATLMEAESLSVTGNPSSAISQQSSSGASGGVFVQLASTAVGQYMEFTTASLPAGTYSLQMQYKNNSNRGQLSFSVDGTAIGTLDQYASPGGTFPTATIGNVTFGTTGTHLLRLTVTGKNASSSNYYLTADLFTFTLSGSPPPAPTGLTATAGNAQVALSWTASSGATSYNVYRGTSAGGESGTAIASVTTGTTCTDGSVTNGTTYFYNVKAVNTNGSSGASNEASATPVAPPPAAPTGLAATAGDSQVSLSWTASAGATSYNVYRGTSAGGESGTAIATGIAATSYTNTGLTNGTALFYTVKAVNSAGTSGASNEASATPAAGTTVTMEAENLSVTGNPSAAISQQSSSSASNGLWVQLASTATAQYMEFTTTSVAAGTYSLDVTYKSNTNRGQLSVTIDGATIGSLDEYAATSSFPTTTIGNVTFGSAGTHLLRMTVTGQNASSSGFYLSADKFTFTSGSQTVPAAPTNLTATAGDTQVALGWTASSGATSYNVYRGTAAGGESGTAIATGLTATSYTDTSLTDGTAYFYVVKAVNSVGTSGASNEASATPVASSWVLTFSDEFDGASGAAPDSTKWNRLNNPTRNTNGAWDPNNVYLDGQGHLVIQVLNLGGGKYSSGGCSTGDAVNYANSGTKYSQTYGKYECSLKMPTQQGWWVSFWMMQGNEGTIGNGSTDGCEVDILEGFGWTDQINQNTIWDGYGTQHQHSSLHPTIAGLRSGWHTVTLVWDPDLYYFYIDGVETFRTAAGGTPCNQPGIFQLTGEISTASWAIADTWAKDPAAATYPDYFYADWVHVYRRGP